MIRIVGIGSPLGDDAVGLAAAGHLADGPPPGCEVHVADRPGVGLVELLDNADAVVLVDAVCSGAPPGTVHDRPLTTAAIAGLASPATSSHALAVAEALRLAEALGRLPSRGRFLGVEIHPEAAAEPRLSEPVRRALPDVVRRARRWVDRLRCPAGGTRPPDASCLR